MASCTPKKPVTDKILNLCRCCNSENTMRRVPLYGNKSKEEGLIETIVRFAELDISENDNFSKWVCRSCATKILTLRKNIDEFKSLCKETMKKQAKELESARMKRGRKDCESSPTSSPIASLNVSKRSRVSESRASRSLSGMFQSIAPKPTNTRSVQSTPPQPDSNSGQRRTLPASFSKTGQSHITASRPKPAESEEVSLLSTCGLQALKNDANVTSTLNSTQKNVLIDEIVKGSPTYLARAIMEIPQLKKCVIVLFLDDINEKCKKLCAISKYKEKPSVLRVSREQQRNLADFKWITILREMKERVPEVLNILMAIAAPRIKNDNSQVAPLCTAFGILMHTRNRELSLVQKLNTVVIGAGHATKKTFQRLAKHGVTQSRESFRNLMDDVGGDLKNEIKDLVKTEGKPRMVFDNLDFKILANIILPNHRNSDMHWIAQFMTFDRFPSDHLDDTKPLVSDVTLFDNKEYLLTEVELQTIKSNFCTLVVRVLVEFFPCMRQLKSVVDEHIPHRYSKEMSKKSCIVGMPIVPFNQTKHSDVCQYLEYVENFLMEVFKPENEPDILNDGKKEENAKQKDRILKGIRLPLCGDLLGRERVTGAKKTRMGCNYETERFDNIIENVAQWHTKQSFLGYIWEKLYQATPICGREEGTLYNFRQQFGMSNVYKDVKKNYKSAEHLMLCSTKAYICCAFMTWAGLENLDDNPCHLIIPTAHSTKVEKKEFVEKQISSFVEQYVLSEFDVEKGRREEIEKIKEKENRDRQSISETAHAIQQTFNAGDIVIMVCGSDVAQRDYQYLGMGKVVESPASTTDQPTDAVFLQVLAVGNSASTLVKVGQVVSWPKANLAVPLQGQNSQSTSENGVDEFADDMTESEQPGNDDQFMNYALQCIQLGIMLMQLNDTEKEGDGERCLMNWKLLMLYFRSRNRGMKYAFEAMRLLTCTKALFTERMAHRIIHGQFINAKGGPGKNYSNDLKMETLVKDHKVILKGLCGNKTLRAVQRSTNAVYGLKNVVEAVDKESKIPPDSTKHTHASSTKIIQEMVNVLKRVKPFHEQPGRVLRSFPQIPKSPLVNLDVTALNKWLTHNKKKLFENAFASSDDVEDDAHETMQHDDDTDEQFSESEEEMEVLLA